MNTPVSAWSTHCWAPTVLNVSLVCAETVGGLLATVSETMGSAGST